ncbi:MAG TPA: AAA family ATPase [Blastocatellia bacterium]|nr:AAA family ATPase [Blastocatellia bacterium]
MSNEINCSIWICSNKTQDECLERNLFGDKIDYYRKGVREGDICFLYNCQADVLFGIFVAVSDPGWNLEPEAWGGAFPYQIRVKPAGEIKAVSDARTKIFKPTGLTMTRTRAGWQIPAFASYGPDITRKLLAHFPIKELPSQEALVSYRPKEGFQSVAGLEDVKRFIRERMIEPFLNPRVAEKYGLRVGGGLLLYGPPGTGKTLIAKATAKEIDAEFIEISPSIVRGFPGEPEQHLERIFQEALQKPRVVIFIDEADALLAAREIVQTSTVMQRIIPAFLRLFTKVFEQNAPVLIIGATNKPGNIDEAFLRPGRFDQCLKVPLPDREARMELLRSALANRPISRELRDHKTLEELADKLDGWTGADIRLLIDRVAHEVFMRQIQRNPSLGRDPDEEIKEDHLLPITLQDILEGIEKKLSGPSVSKEQLKEIEDREKRISSP